MHGRCIIVLAYSFKAKDSPWDAVLMGSVASTVNTNLQHFLIRANFYTITFLHYELFLVILFPKVRESRNISHFLLVLAK